ncbi:lipase family protein [Leucobacter muris]|uniref:lipase family protein n=1 Tax=Leucobacter muris TaxID=1935379 RepID=UPI001E4D6217|nr:lipase family protein [Leucobacter muris]
MTSSASHAGTPLRIMLGLGSVLAGTALFLAPLSPQAIAVVTGAALLLTGVVLLLRTRRDRATGSGRISRTGLALAVLVMLLGAVIAIWPAGGAPGLAFLIGAALVAHGLFSAVRALRSDAPDRASDLIAAVATAAFGALTFTWPVLTLAVFRYGVGAWFVFFGLRTLIELIPRRRSRRGDAADRETDTGGGAVRPSRARRWTRALGSVAALALALLLAYGSGTILGGAPLPEPGRFYAAPAEVPSEPGRLLRAEPLTTGVPAGAQAWRILYTTTHPDGSPAVSSGTVIAPKQLGDEPLPLLTVAHGTTGVVPKCAPSLSAAPFADGAGTALAEMVTQHGWAAVTSDYIGLGTQGTHPYLIGDAEARNVLDASRAVQQLDQLETTTDTVVWGHSQGGQGALWTGQIAGDYAPELTVKGVAAFAPAADLYGLAEADKTDAAGKTVSAYIAATWDRIYPELELERHLPPPPPPGRPAVSRRSRISASTATTCSPPSCGARRCRTRSSPTASSPASSATGSRRRIPRVPSPRPSWSRRGSPIRSSSPTCSTTGSPRAAGRASRSTTAPSPGSATTRSSPPTRRSPRRSCSGRSTAGTAPPPPPTATTCRGDLAGSSSRRRLTRRRREPTGPVRAPSARTGPARHGSLRENAAGR